MGSSASHAAAPPPLAPPAVGLAVALPPKQDETTEPQKVDWLNLPFSTRLLLTLGSCSSLFMLSLFSFSEYICPMFFTVSLKPELFEGLRFDFTKGINQKFSLSHRCLMLTNEPHFSQRMFSFDYKGKDFRTQFQIGNNAFYGANCIQVELEVTMGIYRSETSKKNLFVCIIKDLLKQSVSPYLSLGCEIFWLGHQGKSGIGFTARYNADNMVTTGHVASTGIVALSYVQKVSEKARDLKIQKELLFMLYVCACCYKSYHFQCRLRGKLDSNSVIAAFLEERLNMGVNFILSAEVEVFWGITTRAPSGRLAEAALGLEPNLLTWTEDKKMYKGGQCRLPTVQGPGSRVQVEDMVYPGGPNYVQNFTSSDDRKDHYGVFYQHPMGECMMGMGDLVDLPPEKIAEAADEESDEDIDIEELERRMWRDRMRLKRLKEQQQNKNKEQGDASKQYQSLEQARRKKMSRAQDGILKYMLKMMEVCNAQGFVYGIIPEKGKPVSGASDNLRGWWKEKVRFDRNGPVAIANVMGDFSFNSNSSEYNVEGVDESKSEDVDYKLDADSNAFNFGASSGNGKFIRSPMKEETDMEFIQKRTAVESELVINHRVYTCDNVVCPHNDIRHGFPDRNARNSHQYFCKYQKTHPPGIGMTNNSFQVTKNKPSVIPLPLNSQPNPVNISDLGIPSDGQKSIDELMNFYDNNINGGKNMDLGGVTMFEEVDDLFEDVGSFVEQAQYRQESIVPFEQEFNNQPLEVSGDFSIVSGFNMPVMNSSDAMHGRIEHSLQNQDGFNWFY
ncbi:hypothetical protein C4D60_Mb02t12590 [Musa balbisiana]|uniref:Ethylene insensitive 3-like DNA-binding domain-containing protein n=1 Tax=Musa balbisiana TaxID=52838 RepID=A0A4S8ICJ2_MUSBA|nr:hypothetical protein C4D60_Mb02t12590 [Musa balbisiana]